MKIQDYLREVLAPEKALVRAGEALILTGIMRFTAYAFGATLHVPEWAFWVGLALLAFVALTIWKVAQYRPYGLRLSFAVMEMSSQAPNVNHIVLGGAVTNTGAAGG